MNGCTGLGHKLQLEKPHSISAKDATVQRTYCTDRSNTAIQLRKERQSVGKNLEGTCPSTGHLSHMMANRATRNHLRKVCFFQTHDLELFIPSCPGKQITQSFLILSGAPEPNPEFQNMSALKLPPERRKDITMVENLVDIKERKANECAITQTLQVISCSPKTKLALPQDRQKLGHMLHISLWDLIEVRCHWQVGNKLDVKSAAHDKNKSKDKET